MLSSMAPSTQYHQKEASKDCLDLETIKNKCTEIVPSNLPKEKGMLFEHVFQFQGFWFDPRPNLEVVMSLQEPDYFKAYPTDIIATTYMKCGTTWLKALIFAITKRSTCDFATHPLLTNNPHELVPFLEILVHQNKSGSSPPQSIPSPRLFSTHIPYTLLPKSVHESNCRIVHMCRNPKDAFISLWHFAKKMRSKELSTLSFEEAFELFCRGVTNTGPFWDNALTYWQASLESPDKVFFLRYEDVQRDPAGYVKKLADFLGYPFSLEEEKGGVVEEIVRLCSFANLSNLEVNKSSDVSQLLGQCGLDESHMSLSNQNFFRKGKVGDWKNHLTDEMADRIDQITYEKLYGSGLKLD